MSLVSQCELLAVITCKLVALDSCFQSPHLLATLVTFHAVFCTQKTIAVDPPVMQSLSPLCPGGKIGLCIIVDKDLIFLNGNHSIYCHVCRAGSMICEVGIRYTRIVETGPLDEKSIRTSGPAYLARFNAVCSEDLEICANLIWDKTT